MRLLSKTLERLRSFFARLRDRLSLVWRRLTRRPPLDRTGPMALDPDIDPLYLHPHGAANEAVTLHEGPLTIQGSATGTGTLALRWLPSSGLRLEADLSGIAPHAGGPVKVELHVPCGPKGLPAGLAELVENMPRRARASQKFRKDKDSSLRKRFGRSGGASPIREADRELRGPRRRRHPNGNRSPPRLVAIRVVWDCAQQRTLPDRSNAVSRQRQIA